MRKPKQGGFVPVMIFLRDVELRKNIYRHLLDSEVMKEYFRMEYLETLFEITKKCRGKRSTGTTFTTQKPIESYSF